MTLTLWGRDGEEMVRAWMCSLNDRAEWKVTSRQRTHGIGDSVEPLPMMVLVGGEFR